MADLCENQIIINGKRECLNKLKDEIRKYNRLEELGGSTYFMEYLIGLGNNPPDRNDKRFNKYITERFGTNEDFCQTNLCQTDLCYSTDQEGISISVNSRWSPITPFLSKLCYKYNVTAQIKYFEPASDFGGIAQIDDKGKIDDKEMSFWEATYLFDKDLFWEEVEDYFEDVEEESIDFFVKELPFITPEDRNEIEEMWNSYNE